MRRLFPVLGGMVLFFAGMLSAAEAPPAQRFPSPQGRFEVSFAPPLYDMQRDPDRRSPYAGVPVRKYVVSFFQQGYKTPAAYAEFIDVLESPTAEPTPVKDLADKIIWSPQEDFVLLPREQWDRAPEKTRTGLAAIRLQRQAVSLNTSFPWQTKAVPFEDEPLIWVDGRRLAGNIAEGCRLSVGIFEAREGKTNLVMQGSTPDGYQIVNQMPGKLIIKKVLDACASEQDRARYRQDCVTLDLSFMRREVGVCP